MNSQLIEIATETIFMSIFLQFAFDISWAGGITNEIMLLCLQNMKKHEILLLSSKGSLKNKKQIKFINPNQSHVNLLCGYILCKSISVRNVIKEKIDFKQISKLPPGKVYKISQWSCVRYLKSHIPTWESVFFDLVEKT